MLVLVCIQVWGFVESASHLPVRDAITTVAAWPVCVASDAPLLGVALLGVVTFGVVRSTSLLAAGMAMCAEWLYTYLGVAFAGLAVT